MLCICVFAFACKSTKTTETEDTSTSIPQQFQGKVLVSLMPDREVSEIENDFAKYELEHLSIASRSQNQHLFKFNLDKISAEDLLKKLNRSKKVYLAEALVYKMEKAELMSSGQKKKADIK